MTYGLPERKAMRFSGWVCSASITIALLATGASAQGVFSGGSTAFDPQISVVNTGALLDATPVVSKDLKYVTITARPSVSQLIALRQFPIGVPSNLGFVGSPALQALAQKERGIVMKGGVLPTPSPLDKRGITKLD